MEIRAIQRADTAPVERLFRSVFTDSEGEQEGALVGGLATAMMSDIGSANVYGFLAATGERISGSIFFSRLTFDTDLDVFILAPVAVDTEHQGKGIGQALIRHGLEAMKRRGVRYVTTYGDPAFYARVGFHPVSQSAIEPPYPLSRPEGWLGQTLGDTPIDAISGRCACVEALSNPLYW